MCAGNCSSGARRKDSHPADARMARRDGPPLQAGGSTHFTLPSHRAHLLPYTKPRPPPLQAQVRRVAGGDAVGRWRRGTCCSLIQMLYRLLLHFFSPPLSRTAARRVFLEPELCKGEEEISLRNAKRGGLCDLAKLVLHNPEPCVSWLRIISCHCFCFS